MIKPYVIGIAGGTASGKTTFCEKLDSEINEVNRKIFHMDEYFKPKTLRPYVKAFVKGKEYMDDNHPLTVDLTKLKNDIKNSLEEKYKLIIVEGLLTLWDDNIFELLDLKIFLDCKADERIVRRIKRNMKRGLTLEEITDIYLDMVRYRHDEYVEPSKWRADIIINGSEFPDKAIKMIKEYVVKEMAQ